MTVREAGGCARQPETEEELRMARLELQLEELCYESAVHVTGRAVQASFQDFIR